MKKLNAVQEVISIVDSLTDVDFKLLEINAEKQKDRVVENKLIIQKIKELKSAIDFKKNN